MTPDIERFVEETLAQASRSAPVSAGVPVAPEKAARRWLSPALVAGAVGSIAVAATMLGISGYGRQAPVGTSPYSATESACTPLDRTVEASKAPNYDLTGEALASALNQMAHNFEGAVSLTFQPPDGFWLIVDAGQERWVPDLLRNAEELKAPEPIMVRESCMSQEQLRTIQEQIASEYSHKGLGQVSSDLNLLQGQVEVFTSIKATGEKRVS